MKRKHGLLRPTVLRRIAREACAEYGIKATRISRAWLADMENTCTKYVRQSAVQSVGDTKKTIGGEG